MDGGAGAEQGDGAPGHDGFGVLVEHLDVAVDDAAVGLAAAAAGLGDGDAQAQAVSRSDRAGPAQRVQAGRAHGGVGRDEVVDQQAHGDGGGVPAAGHEFAEGGGAGGLGVGVEGLGVVAGGEADDLGRGHQVVAEFVDLSGGEVLEPAFGRGHLYEVIRCSGEGSFSPRSMAWTRLVRRVWAVAVRPISAPFSATKPFMKAISVRRRLSMS